MADPYRNLTEAQKALTPLERVLAGTYQMVPYDAATNRGLYEDGHRLLYDAMMADAAALTEQMGATAAAVLIGSLAPRTVVRLTSASFYEAGNKTADYPANRAVVLAQTSSGVGYVSGSTYNAGATRTEVTVAGITVDTGLTQAVLGLDPKYAPRIADASSSGRFLRDDGTWAFAGQSWTPAGAFTRTADATFTVTDNATNQEIFRLGRPIRYRATAGTWRCGIVTGYTTGTVTVAGAPLTTSDDDEMQYGDMSRVVQETFSFSGYFADAADSALIEHDLLTRYLWRRGKAYCVHFSARPLVDDSGAAQPRVNVTCAGAAVSTSNSNAGLAVSDSAWVSTTTDVSTSNYDITWGEALEVSVDANGTNDNASDLTVIVAFVLE